MNRQRPSVLDLLSAVAVVVAVAFLSVAALQHFIAVVR